LVGAVVYDCLEGVLGVLAVLLLPEIIVLPVPHKIEQDKNYYNGKK